MIISKTPLRISYFGGGTDLPEFYKKHGGAVLGTAIDKYIYHTISHFPSKLFDYSVRISYSKVERVQNVSEIEHVPFREILHSLKIERDIEIHVASDLPSFSGLGTSSAFTVGLIKALHAFKGSHISREQLTYKAIAMERETLKEVVGCQDQTFAAHGGLNLIEFTTAGTINVERIAISNARRAELNASLMLFFTGITRRAQNIESNKIKNIEKIEKNLLKMLGHVEQAHKILSGNMDLSSFGILLDKTWNEKKELDRSVSNKIIDEMYKDAIRAGALGGKLLGAGGGGFMLFYVPHERKQAIRSALRQYHEIPFQIDAPGSTIIHD